MEIRKADAKGRMTGFTPGAYYELHHTALGVVLKPVAPTTEKLIECPHWNPGSITLRSGCTSCEAS